MAQDYELFEGKSLSDVFKDLFDKKTAHEHHRRDQEKRNHSHTHQNNLINFDSGNYSNSGCSSFLRANWVGP